MFTSLCENYAKFADNNLVAFEPTGAWLFVKPPQWCAETTEGTLKTASPVFKQIGVITDWTKEVKIENDQTPILGSRDIYSQLLLGYQYSFSIKYRPIATTLDLAKYGVNLPNLTTPAGTNAESVSFLASKIIDGTEKFKTYTGARTTSITIEVTRAGGVVITQNFKCLHISHWGAEPTLTTPTYVHLDDITGDAISGISSGQNPLTIASVNYYTPRFSTTIDQTATEFKPNGEQSALMIRPTNRRITVSMDTLTKDAALITAMEAYGAQACTYNLTPTVHLAYASLKFDSYSEADAGGSADFSTEAYSGTAKTVELQTP